MDATYRQEPPFAIQIELTQGCNLRCTFCGIQGITDKPMEFDFMSRNTLKVICEKIQDSGWTSRLEFAMHGEPTANPEWIALLRMVRETLGPRRPIMLTTNGYGFLHGGGISVAAKLRAARSICNVVAIDAYEYVNLATKIEEVLKEKLIPYFWYPKDKEANPHRRRQWYENDIVLVQDISIATSGTHSSLNNHCGAAFEPNHSKSDKRCAKPFRELSIRWDGRIALCCNDWRGEYDCGDIRGIDRGDFASDLEALWNSGPFYAARAQLYNHDRRFGPCDGCDAVSYRNGLLPDKKGRLNHPLPDEFTDGVIKSLAMNPPMSKVVKRPWE